MHTPVGIVGASGYSGIELTRILAGHPSVELKFATSDRWQGDTVKNRLGVGGKLGSLKYAPLEMSVELAAGCQVVLLATPAESSLELVPKLLERGVKVIDLSGSFRLTDAAEYPKAYNFTHGRPELLAEAVYGLPELNREKVKKARLVANPGCYPTVSMLPLLPLLSAGLLEEDSLIIDAASGVTGAGRKASEDLSFSEVDEDYRAYRVLRHQHGPEIGQLLSLAAGTKAFVTFTAHLLPVKRGILATIHARLKKGVEPARALEVLTNKYAAEPFVGLLKAPDEVNLKSVVGTNRCLLAAAADAGANGRGRVLITSAIDNLVKGAAGQAVQNLNLMIGVEETTALDTLRGFYP